MSRNRAKNSRPEVTLRKALWKAGLRGYRLHYKKGSGRPDISFVSKKLAIFVNGCFWHRCPKCDYKIPKTNSEFWRDKFAKNIERDKQKKRDLENGDWRVLTFWECNLQNDASSAINTIKTTPLI